MSFKELIGFGGTLEIDTAYNPVDTQTPVWVVIGQIIDFAENKNVAEIDVTHRQSSAAPPWMSEWKPGKVDVDVTFNVVFDPGSTEHKAVLQDHVGIVRQFRYTFADEDLTLTTPSVWTFEGFYKTMSTGMPMEDKHTSDVTIRVSGVISYVGRVA